MRFTRVYGVRGLLDEGWGSLNKRNVITDHHHHLVGRYFLRLCIILIGQLLEGRQACDAERTDRQY
jgi:hypothetical protein